jgi:hypothetical protein
MLLHFFFQLKTDKTSIKADVDTVRYFKTSIRFGFKDDANIYQLPGSFYIREPQNNYSYPLNAHKIAYKQPCIMFANEVFYIFVPNFIGKGRQEATLFTYSVAKGLTKQILWTDGVQESALLPYFRADKAQGFALMQNSENLSSVINTKVEKNNLVTRTERLKVYLPQLESDYSKQIQPFFLPLKAQPFKKATITYKRYNPYCDLSVFLNTPKDKALFNRLSSLPVPPNLVKVAREDYNKFRIIIFNVDSLNATRVFYNEEPHTKSLVQDMPKTKDQDPFSSCVSYAYGALYAQWINNDWELKAMRKIEPNALKKETDISYFGMQQYFRGNKQGVDSANLWRYPKDHRPSLRPGAPEFDFKPDTSRIHYFPFEILLQNENRLDSIPYFVQSYYFKKYGSIAPLIDGKNKLIEEIFEDYLKQLYLKNHTDIKANSSYRFEIAELSAITGIPGKNLNLQKAFAQPTFRSFMYQIFFNNCFDYVSVAYKNNLEVRPITDLNVNKQDIINLVQQGAPVLININSSPNSDPDYHVLVISGYKKLIDPNTGAKVDAFKLHNSWGDVWDEQTNDGWFLADNILSYCIEDYSFISKGTDYIQKALREEWIENTDDYQRIYKGEYPDPGRRWGVTGIGASTSNHQTDPTPLLLAMKNKTITFREFSDFMQAFFKKLGYKFVTESYKEDGSFKKGVMNFEGGITISYYRSISSRHIEFPTRQMYNQFKFKLDFNKTNGEFGEERFVEGICQMHLRRDYE